MTMKTKSQERTVAIITGLKIGDPNILAHQPCTMANVAFELGRVDRKTFLAEVEKVLDTKQIAGRLFSFHKQALITGKFIKFEKLSKSKWKEETAKETEPVSSNLMTTTVQ